MSTREPSEFTDGGLSKETPNPAPQTARLISIDENTAVTNMASMEVLGSKTPAAEMKKQDSIVSSESSITSFTNIAMRHKNKEKPDSPDKNDDDVFTNTDVKSSDEKSEKPLPVPRKTKPSTNSSSLNNILSDSKENISKVVESSFTTLPREKPKLSEDVESSFTTLPRDKPRPKPRVARKSESDRKKNHAYEDIDSVAKPKPRVARKSESDGKVQGTVNNHVHEEDIDIHAKTKPETTASPQPGPATSPDTQ